MEMVTPPPLSLADFPQASIITGIYTWWFYAVQIYCLLHSYRASVQGGRSMSPPCHFSQSADLFCVRLFSNQDSQHERHLCSPMVDTSLSRSSSAMCT